ncbi:hypothetical protein QTH27_03920 [Clostridium perfringens]|uniref:hypothetical protein n=1 Tax=Clostridium perfringens TaxID=1502 RepID=UPI0029795B72|nr:hypothetical protein [Clostridium perfringens]MDM0476930.1 hypothetical protein [Clostridium perfringens]MDM0479761.1 hypothetical protein [Clostridium perfringens]MDM0484928.1 hypothetical protein [Clostridium perfringens]
MNRFIEKLIDINSTEYNYHIKESFDKLEIKIESSNITFIYDELSTIHNLIPPRDHILDLKFKIEDSEPIILSQENFKNFIDDVNSEKDYKDSDELEVLEFSIKKNITNSFLSIYSLEEFSKFLNSLTLETLLKTINNNLRNNCYKHLYFLVLDEVKQDINSHSNIFSFISSNDFIINSDFISCKTLNERFKFCKFENHSEFKFDPYDFKMDTQFFDTIDLTLKKLCIIFSLISIFDSSKIENDTINLTLYGKIYKSFSINFKTFNISNLNYTFDIFEWIYNDKNIVDRLMISRNVLSKYLLPMNEVNITKDIVKAIKSNYKIYLKENFEQYVSIKNNIIDSLLKVETETMSLLNSFTDNFIKNMGAICTFIFSAIILNSFSDKKFENIFTKDITLISVILILISIVFLALTYKDIMFKYKIVSKITENISLNYKDLLDIEEVDKIFSSYDSITSVDTSFKKRINYYTYAWIIVIILISIITFLLGFQHFKYCWDLILNFFYNIFLTFKK